MVELVMHDVEETHNFGIESSSDNSFNERSHDFGSGDSDILHTEKNKSEVQEKDSNEENHQFGSNDSEILHNDENQSEAQVQSENIVVKYGTCSKIIGPDGYSWIPEVEPSLICALDTVFEDIKAGVKWYAEYALRSGFDVRRSTERKSNSGITTSKYFVCHRSGLPHTSTLDTISDDHNKELRNSNCKRTHCKAFVAFKMILGTEKYKPSGEVIPDSAKVYLWRFFQQHNHELISQDCMYLSRAKRQVDVIDQSFILKMSSASIGPTKAFRLMCVIKGGYEYVGGLEIDWKNFTRDTNCHIAGTDANLLITKLLNRKENVQNFSYDYRCDKKQLNAIFWADETSKLNYESFGDVVSFDATYRTNRYCMVFVPFTGIDNHKKCVTFGVALLSREDIGSYIWLLRSFLKCFKKAPHMVITDQDPSMKVAIEIVFPNTRHRFCMWHITSKLPVKVSWEIMNNSQFKTDFNNIVWDPNIDENDFEIKWKALMIQYGLGDNTWMNTMFDLRSHWIPAFFKHVPMSCLMRTTSRSESENSAFNMVSHHGYTLNNFMNAFESVMERQRHNQIKLDFDTSTTIPIFKTPLEDMEKHASMVYTREIFLMVQKEILHSLVSCSQKSVTSGIVSDICIVKEKISKSSKKKVVVQEKEKEKENETGYIDLEYEWNLQTIEGEFEVEFNREDFSVKCACMLFERFGILCRHVFCILKLYDVEEIPSRYILKRWRRDIIPTSVLKQRFRYGDSSSNVDKVAYKAYSILDTCLSKLSKDDNKLEDFFQKFEVFMTDFTKQASDEVPVTKQATIEQFYGSTSDKDADVDVENPAVVNNKGGRKRTRFQSVLEKSGGVQKKSRTCSVCGVKGHNSRKCLTLLNKEKDKAKANAKA